MDEKYSLNLTAKMNKFSRMFEHSGADKRMNQVEIVAKCSSSKKRWASYIQFIWLFLVCIVSQINCIII